MNKQRNREIKKQRNKNIKAKYYLSKQLVKRKMKEKAGYA